MTPVHSATDQTFNQVKSKFYMFQPDNKNTQPINSNRQVHLLAVAVQKQVYDKSLPCLLFTECVQSGGCEGKA